MLPKLRAYRRDFDETKYMFFLNKDDELLEKYNKIWDKGSSSVKKRFDNEPVYNEKYLKAKIKSLEEKISTHFYNDSVPKEGPQYMSYQ